jgi:cobalt-precorrin 5A hydrolase/precorrin-3B C17-methyltransferase
MTVFVALTATGAALATRLAARLPGAEVHGLRHRATAPVSFTDTIAHLRDLFASGRPIVGVCASGILIRALAPLITNKQGEPPVLAVAEDGSAVVPLLGGHQGGNQLARSIADTLGIAAAITTASDLGGGTPLDDPPSGWTIGAGPRTRILADLVAAAPVGLAGPDYGWPPLPRDQPVRVTVGWTVPADGMLGLHPRVLALGVGTERGLPAAELIAFAERELAAAAIVPASIAAVVSIDLKRDEPAVHALAAHLGVPARFFSAARLAVEQPPNPSSRVLAETGTPSVAEAAALAATGGRLIVEKRKDRGATLALAVADHILDPSQIGGAPGRLSVVGIGPGDAATRTAEVSAALTSADAVVGYGLYLDLVADLIPGTPRYETGLGAETERARVALDLAGAGRHVCLVCSGDAGIYALATLVMELQDQVADPAWRGVTVSVLPGVSAMQVAAARLGAPLGHDFAAISLSDLLTPWSVIEQRVAAAAAGDFVVAFYNPRSERRDWQLARAVAILKQHRPPTTPVATCRDLGRPGERIAVTTLAAFDPATVDMLTLVVVGSSASRVFATHAGLRVYTPRGYDPAGVREVVSPGSETP